MKFKSIITLFVICLLAACSADDSLTKDLEAQITKLQTTITELQGTITTLNSSNSTISTQLKTAQDAVDTATASLANGETKIGDLQKQLETLNDELSKVDYSATVALDATGSVADMSSSQAKKTIYGKWDIGGASSSKSIESGCSFKYIEFTENKYFMAINDANSDTKMVFGPYALKENTEGKVISVDLMYDAGDSDITIAVLTNIVVTKDTDDELSATFDVVLTLPAALEYCEASLPGSVSSVKDKPVEEAKTATAVSNHAMVIGEWDLVSYTATDMKMTIYDQYCMDENATYNQDDGSYTYEEVFREGCVAPTAVVINISNFGTYSLTWIGGNGPIEVEVEGWKWTNSSQNAIMFGDADSMEYADNEFIVSVLTREEMILSGSHTNEKGEAVEEKITLKKRK
jgi:hypothetical protein